MRWWNGLARREHKLALALVVVAHAANADTAFITCQNGNALDVIALDSGAVIDQRSVPGKPAGVAVSDQHVFTVSPDSKTIRKTNAVSDDLLAEITLDGGPIGIALDPGRERVFVSDWYNARLWVLDLNTLQLRDELSTGPAPAGISLSEDGRWLATADKEVDQVSLFDADTLELARRIAVGTRPFGLRFAPDGRLFVGNVGSNDVTVIDPVSGETLATIPVGERPYGVSFAQGRAFVTNQYENTVSVIDLTTLDHLTKVEVGEYPEGIDTTADQKQVVLANWFDNTISVIDATTLTVVDTIDTCDGPRAFGVFVANGGAQ